MRENSGLKGSKVGLVRRVGLMLASLVMRASESMEEEEVAILRRRMDEEAAEEEEEEGTRRNAREDDGEQSATATAIEWNSMIVVDR